MNNIPTVADPLRYFIPRIAQCSVSDGLTIGWIAALSTAATHSAVGVLAGHPLSFEFVARNDVAFIYLQFGTYARKNKGKLTSRILDATGAIVSESRQDLGSLKDNEYALLHDVRNTDLVPGRNYTLNLESSAEPSEKIAVWGDVGTLLGEKAIVISNPRNRFFFRRRQRRLGTPARIGIVSSIDMTSAPFQHFAELRESAAANSIFDSGELLQHWSSILDNDVIFFLGFDEFTLGCRPDIICYALHFLGVVTVAVAGNKQRPSWATCCQYTLSINDICRDELFDNISQKPIGSLGPARLAHILDEDQKQRTPSIAIFCRVSDQPRIAREIDPARIEASGSPLEFVCISDEACEANVDAVGRTFTSWAQAILAASQDIIIFAGPDISITTEFVESHIFEHWYRDVEVVLSRLSRNPGVLDASERKPAGGDDDFCDFRALSLKSRSARLDAVEAFLKGHDDFRKAGAIFSERLQARGAIIRKSAQSATLLRTEQPQSKTGNARHIFPQRLLAIGEKWSRTISRSSSKTVASGRLRILSYRWHAAHQYEIFRLPFDFTLTRGFGSHITEVWPYMERPLRPNVTFRYRSEIDPRDYDLCLIHFDENVLCPELSNGILPPNWGEPFLWLLSFDNLPKIAVCHGTPPFEGQYARDKDRKTKFDILNDQRAKLVSMLSAADTFVVCNSWQARREWGFANSRVIWHGFDPQEFRVGSHSRDILTLPHDHTRPHYRGCFEQLDVERLLDPDIEVARGGPAGVPIEMRTTNAFADRQYRAYIDHIGQFKVYLNTTLRSPMPRSRGEAMMTGVIPVSLANHDVEMFIDNGVDGFYAEKPEDLASFIKAVIRDKGALANMSAAARKKAFEIFHCRRFQNDWRQLLEDRLGRRLPLNCE